MFTHQLTKLTWTYILKPVISFVTIIIKALVFFVFAAEDIARKQVQIGIDSFN